MKELDLSLSSDLCWDLTKDPEEVYFLNFGFHQLNPFNSTTWHGHLLAVEEFAKAFPEAKKVVMARLDGNFSSLIAQTEQIEEERGKSELPSDLFSAQLFSDYLHRLAALLPAEATPTLLVSQAPNVSQAFLVIAFCKRRFEHFQVTFEGDQVPVEGDYETIVSLPQDVRFDQQLFEGLFSSLESFKCIPEELLNEYWDAARVILYDPKTIGALGERMLLGFEAAGGEVRKMISRST